MKINLWIGALLSMGTLTLLSTPREVAAQCEPVWQPGLPNPGLAGSANCIAAFPPGSGGAIYFGGAFGAAGSHIVDGLAIWADDHWIPVPGWPGQAGDVVGALLSEADRLLIARARRDAQGRSTSDILAFDGATWTTIASGAPGVVHSMDWIEGSLWVLADPAAGCSCGGLILRWDGQGWQTATTGLNPCATVRRLRMIGSDWLALGDESEMFANRAEAIARWDGAAWVPFGGALLGGRVHDAVLFQGNPVFVGFDLVDRSRPAGQGGLGSAAAFTNAGWIGLGQLSDFEIGFCGPSPAMRVILHQSQLAVVGFEMPGIVRVFDGATWSTGPISAEVLPTALLSAQGELWLALSGIYPYSGPSFTAAKLEQGSVRPLHQADSLNSGTAAQVVGTSSGIVGLGSFGSSSTVTTGVARFDQDRWTTLGNPTLFSESALVSNRQGLFLLQSPVELGDRVLEWTGADWVPTPLPSGNRHSVTTASHEGALVATSPADGQLLRWDGQSWSPLTPQPPVALGWITAGGPRDLFGIHTVFADQGIVGYRAYRLRAGVWTEISPGLPSSNSRYRFVVHGEDIYLMHGGGLFRLAANDWQPISTGLGRVDDAISLRDTLYVAGGQGVPGVVKLANGVWTPVDRGTQGSAGVRSLAIFQGDLWAAGAFGAIGGQVSANIAHLACPCPADFDQSGASSPEDVFAFLNAWLGDSPRSDSNGDGDLTVQDLFDFLDAYFRACVV